MIEDLTDDEADAFWAARPAPLGWFPGPMIVELICGLRSVHDLSAARQEVL